MKRSFEDGTRTHSRDQAALISTAIAWTYTSDHILIDNLVHAIIL